MDIREDTRVSDILREYGDIADVMMLLGVKPVGAYSVRALAARFITVKWAARIHRVPLEEFVEMLRLAVRSKASPPPPV